MPRQAFVTLFKPRALFVAGILSGLAACAEPSASKEDDFSPVFWEQPDSFTEMTAYYLNAKVWIDRENGQYLDLQFQCFRHSGAQLSIDQNLIVNSSVDPSKPNGWARRVDAILFKPDGNSPRVYRYGSNGEVLSNFTDAQLDLGYMLSRDENDNYRSLQLRFVHGASSVIALAGDVGALSRAASVDFDLSTTDPETEKFLQACAPVKNWVPPS